MENLSHYSRHPNRTTTTAAAASLSKKKSSTNGATTGSYASASMSVYDDVFGGPPKLGAAAHHTTKLSPRADDYAEIFGSFHAPRASSIPVLDLPSVDGEAEVFFDVQSSGFDYGEVFGGFSCPDFAVSYDELLRMDRSNDGRGCSSSDEAWTPEGGESLSEESDDPAKAQFMSNGEFYEIVDGSMEFNISYHKASQTSNGDMPNGTTHVAPLNNAFHGYSVKVHKSDSLQPDDEYPTQLVSDDGHLEIDLSGETDGRHFSSTLSQPFSVGTEKIPNANETRPQKVYDRNSSLPAREFVTIKALSLKTEPSHLPPPARPPPAVEAEMKNSDKLSRSHKVAASEWIASDCSAPYFGEEVDESSAAAASAAAMKEAMEKAQAKLKSAKESLERKKEGIQRRAGSGSRTGRQNKEENGKVVDRWRNTEDGNVNGSYQKEENGGEFITLTERQKVKRTTNPISESSQRRKNIVSPKTVGKYDRESVSSQGSDEIDEAGEWKEAAQFFELVREKSDQPSEQANNENVPFQNTNINGHEYKGKKVATEVLERQYDSKVKHEKLDTRADSHGKTLDLPKESIAQNEVQMAQEAFRREENDKRSRKHWHRPAETEKKHARGDGFLRHHNVVDILSNKSTPESKQAVKHREEELLPKWAGKMLEEENQVDQETEKFQKERAEICKLQEEEKRLKELLEREENEKNQKEVQEREEKERKRREALQMEENERRLKEDFERGEHERRLQEAAEQEKNERKLREAFELEESERRHKETLAKEEVMRREAVEQAENEKRQREATELAENEKRKREASEREESEKRMQEAFEKEEEKERRSRDDAGKSGDYEKGQKEDLAREETDEKINDSFELEQNRHKEEVEEQAVEETSEEFCNVKLSHTLEEEQKETNTSKPHEVVESETAGEAACQTEELLDFSLESTESESLESEELFMEYKAFDGNGPKKGQNESGEPQSVSYQELDEDKKLEETRVPEALGNEEKQATPNNPGLGGKSAAKTVGNSSSLEEKKFANDKVERQKNVNEVENMNDSISAKAVKQSIEAGRKIGATQPLAAEVKEGTDRTTLRADDASETLQRKVENLNQPSPQEDIESARLKREKDIEMERLRKMEEERDREREREKDRMAVDKALLESREKAERAVVERAMKEARERLEKACADARGKSFSDKTSDIKLRAERAAVEKATAEARERAFERARTERYASYENNGLKQCSSSDSQFQNASSANGYRNGYSSAYSGERSEVTEGESAQRCKARLERYRRTAERAAKALAEKNMRDVQAQREQAERNRLAETLDAEIKRWSSGKEGNLRALLSTLQYILGQESGWHPIPLTEVITAAAVRRAYRKATLCVHPDKLQQRGASIHHKYICGKVFDLLKEAWNRFNSEER